MTPDVQYVRVIVGYGHSDDEIVYTILKPDVEKLSITQPEGGPMTLHLLARGEGGMLNTGTV